MSDKVAVPVRVNIPGHVDATRIATGYVGKDKVAVDVDGHTHLVDKDEISPAAHRAINEAKKEKK